MKLKIMSPILVVVGLLMAACISGCSCNICSCIEWNPATVTWEGPSIGMQTLNYNPNGVTVSSLFAIYAGTSILIDSSVECSAGCDSHYVWSIIKDPNSGPPEGPWFGTNLPASFAPTSPGGFTANLTAACGTHDCETFQFQIGIKEIQPMPCMCLDWSPATITWNGTPPEMAIIGCGSNYSIPGSIFFGTDITVDSSINCSALCNTSSAAYNWTVTKQPGSGDPETPVFGTTLPVSFSPYTDGTFKVELNAACGNVSCEPCIMYISIKVDDPLPTPSPTPTPTCLCSYWNQPTVTWDGPSSGTQTVSCGSNYSIPETICSGTNIFINSDVNCSTGCNSSYTWSVIPEPGMGPPEGPWSGTNLPASFSPVLGGNYAVTLNAWCGGTPCPPCTINVAVNLSSCIEHAITLSACVCNASDNGSPNPSNDLVTWIDNYFSGSDGSRPCDDYTTVDQNWMHTFGNLTPPPCCQIQSAILNITVHTGGDNDGLWLGFVSGNNSSWPYSAVLDNSVTVDNTGTITVNLDSTLLSGIETNGFLDVVVQDDSGVDCATLVVTYGP